MAKTAGVAGGVTWTPRVVGALALGIASFIASPILVRLASAAAPEAPGLAIAVWRTAFATLLLAPVALVRIGPDVRRLAGRDALWIGVSGVLLGLHFVAWIESLYHTTVASASVLVTTSPLFLAAFGYVVLGERLGARTLAAIGAGVAGAVLIGAADAEAGFAWGGGALWGNALALGASLLVSGYLLIGRAVRQRVRWLAYVFPLYAVAAATTLTCAWAAGVPLGGYGAGFYGLCLAMAVGPQILGHGSFNYAVQFLPAALVSMLALLEPVGASALAFVLFGEAAPPVAVAGMAGVLASVAAVVRLRGR